VRKGADDNERRLTFKRLEGISALELLDRGLAIDGDQAACSITGHFDRSDGAWTFTYPTFEPSGFAGDVGAVATQDTGDLISALLYAERRLANFLRELGYNVEFAL
jgi:hypothetical protein